MLESTSPLIYSEMESGVAKTLRKLRDQTSSKNVVVTPCMTRVKKSHSSTAPSRDGTKLKPEPLTEFKYLVMNPQVTMSMATQANSGTTRAGLPCIRKNWRRTMAEVRRNEYMR